MSLVDGLDPCVVCGDKAVGMAAEMSGLLSPMRPYCVEHMPDFHGIRARDERIVRLEKVRRAAEDALGVTRWNSPWENDTTIAKVAALARRLAGSPRRGTAICLNGEPCASSLCRVRQVGAGIGQPKAHPAHRGDTPRERAYRKAHRACEVGIVMHDKCATVPLTKAEIKARIAAGNNLLPVAKNR